MVILKYLCSTYVSMKLCVTLKYNLMMRGKNHPDVLELQISKDISTRLVENSKANQIFQELELSVFLVSNTKVENQHVLERTRC